MRKERSIKIYALIDPRDGAVRYVGKTQTKISDRVKLHLRAARRPKNKNYTHKEAWLKGLLDSGLRPQRKILEEVPIDGDWASREIWWIATAADRGWKLTNISTGGDAGAVGVRHSEERKRQIAERMKGNSFGKGFKWNAEQRAKRMAHFARPEFREAMAAASRGKKQSAETIEKRVAKMRGDNHWGARVSALEVIAIRERAAKGETRKALADEYGIGYSHMCRIIKGSSWSWL